jgi:hypothetical protein
MSAWVKRAILRDLDGDPPDNVTPMPRFGGDFTPRPAPTPEPGRAMPQGIRRTGGRRPDPDEPAADVSDATPGGWRGPEGGGRRKSGGGRDRRTGEPG